MDKEAREIFKTKNDSEGLAHGPVFEDFGEMLDLTR